jgi:hypothetical protein
MCEGEVCVGRGGGENTAVMRLGGIGGTEYGGTSLEIREGVGNEDGSGGGGRCCEGFIPFTVVTLPTVDRAAGGRGGGWN